MLTTHICDQGVGALGSLLVRAAQLLVHTRLLLGAPHTPVLWVGVLTETAVLPPHGAVVQGDCRGSSEGKISKFALCYYSYIEILYIQARNRSRFSLVSSLQSF